ncbi:Dabb family protein [Christensenella tenuis]|uniref:Dabb family protein n=1 Tax=Christensenella tenuis TaxID=2763033 RepID=A0ABR7EE85_9FIRM|nr:Dabb family protein [Christensenella tenuis]MBC5647661.1 Dabb family protein [Christensenella tenuis]
MVRHIILWKIKEEVKDPEAAKAAMKRELEALMGKIDGLLEMEVITRPLPSCNADVMLKSAFTDAQALADYIIHPEHKRVGQTFVRPVVTGRMCMDYED